MLAIEITLNAFVIAGMVMLAFFVGFLIRGQKLASLHEKIAELETEMLNNHANILQLQHEKALLENQLQQSQIPVIPITSSKDDKDNSNKISELAMRKKLLSQQAGQKH